MSKYVYHFYATQKLSDDGCEQQFDGLVSRDLPFSGDWDEYRELKRRILCDLKGQPDSDWSALVIQSLTLVNPGLYP